MVWDIRLGEMNIQDVPGLRFIVRTWGISRDISPKLLANTNPRPYRHKGFRAANLSTILANTSSRSSGIGITTFPRSATGDVRCRQWLEVGWRRWLWVRGNSSGLVVGIHHTPWPDLTNYHSGLQSRPQIMTFLAKPKSSLQLIYLSCPK